jgi:hypothetical protein
MIKLWKKISISLVLLTSATMNVQASVINYSLPVVNNTLSTDYLTSWFSTGIISEEIDSFTLNFKWKDQGWGNQKGRIYYQSGDSGWKNLGLLADHSWTVQSQTIFSNSLTDFDVAPLEFAYRVGGGSGHKLYIQDAALTIRTSIPAPATFLLLGLGLIGLSFKRRKV